MKITYSPSLPSFKELAAFLQNDECQFFPPLTELTNLDSYLDKLLRFANFYICRDENGILIGVLAGYSNNEQTKEGFISALIVKKSFRCHGVAQQLLRDFLHDLKRKKMLSVILNVYEQNEKAIRFYQKNGFCVENIHNGWYKMRRIL